MHEDPSCKPPFTNRGAVITSLSVAVDWLSFTFRGVSVETLCAKLLALVPGEFFTAEVGRYGYEHHLIGPGKCSVLWSGRPERAGEVHVQLPGRFCAAVDEAETREFVAWALEAEAKPVRIDLAADDFARRVMPSDVWQAVASGDAVTRTTRGRFISDRVTGGDSCEVGKRGARSFLRVYDKEAQSGGSIASVRWEVEVRDDHAQAMAERLVTDPWGDVWSSFLVRIVDFRERAADVNISRCPRLGWFLELVGDGVHARVRVAAPDVSFEAAVEFCERQVFPLLSAVLAGKGGDVGWLVERLMVNRDRWRVKHRLIAAAA
jgi:hypothetical protein